MDFYPVIMCGGSGARLWPLSRPSLPKQFIPVVSEFSSFQQAALRMSRLKGAHPPLVVAGLGHAARIAAELAAIGVEAEILLEPTARDSAPAVAAAAAWIARRDPGGIAVIVASDHHLPDDEAFLAAVSQAAEAARRGRIVTLGVAPSGPSTAYGYINAGEPLDQDPAVRHTAAFVEKPDLETASGYVAAGYLWNSGNFIATAETLLNQLDQYAPAVSAAARDGVAGAVNIDGGWRLGPGFTAAPRISLDYAVMERTDRAAVLPVAFPWSDLGAWDAVWQASRRDERGNSGDADTLFLASEDCLVRTPPGLQTAIIGGRRLAVIADESGLLVCDLDHSQGVKAAAEHFAGRSPRRPPQLSPEAWADRLDQWLRTSALPLWWTVGADHVRGGFHDQIDHAGRALVAPRRARVQTRQAFVYAVADRLGFDGPWKAAAAHGLSYFQARFLRPDGLYRAKVNPDGTPAEEAPYLYDQAFALMSMATVYRSDPARGDLRLEAERLMDAIRRLMSAPAGGFQETGDHPFQANAQMHLLEAALAWSEVSDNPAWISLAEGLVDLALTRFIDPEGGFLREFFDRDWRPSAGADSGLVEPGHQFEWAWLLQRWALARGSAPAHAAAVKLFANGLKGVDHLRSVAMDELNDDLTVRSARARLWPQTEYVKAALILARDASPDQAKAYLACAAEGAAGLWRYLETPVVGLWRDKLGADDRYLDEPAPASSLYHIVGAVVALMDHRDLA